MGSEPPFPPEVWEHIFRHCPDPDLKRLRLVCHRWDAITTGCPSLWGRFHVRISSRTESLSPEMIPPVRRATFDCDIEAASSWWPRLAGKLEELSFDGGGISVTALFDMLKHCSNLKRLFLSQVWLLAGEVDGSFSLDSMEELSICDIYLNEIDLPSHFVPIFQSLKKFSLHYVDDWEGTFAINWWINFVHEVQGTLESVALPPEFFLVRQLCQMDRLQLKHVKLSTKCSPNSWDTELWNTFCRSQQSLQDLIISGDNITDEILCATLQNLPNLRNLDTDLSCSHQIVPTFLNGSTTLRCAKICGFPANLQFLNQLSSTLTDLTLTNVTISEGVEYLINSPNIVSLYLASCDLSGCRVPKTGELSILRHLKLSNCKTTPEMISYMLSCHPRLEKAGLFGMESVDEGVIVKLLCASPKLQEIRSYKCSRLGVATSGVEIMQNYFMALNLNEGSREVRFDIA